MSDGKVVIETDLELKGIEKGIKEIEKVTKKINTSELDKSLDKTKEKIENSTNAVKKQMKEIETATKSTGKEISNLTEKANKTKIEIDTSKAKKDINGLDGEFRSASMSMTKEFEQAAKKSEKSISDMTTKSKSHFSNLASAAKTSLSGIATVVGAIGTAGVGLGVAIGKIGSDFESQMSRVKAISGATNEEFKKLQDQAIQLGADTSFSSKEAAEGMENLASAGFTTNEIIVAMPGLLDLAASSGESLASSSDIAASTLRGFGLEADQAGHVADVLAKNAGATNAAVADTGEAMKYIAPVAHSMGLSIEEVTAAIGELANAGIKGLNESCGPVVKKLAA